MNRLCSLRHRLAAAGRAAAVRARVAAFVVIAGVANAAWPQSPEPDLGPRIAQNREFTVHSLQVEAAGASARCPGAWAGAPPATDAAEAARANDQMAREMQSRREVILKRYGELQRPPQDAISDANRQHRAGSIDRDELVARVERAQAEQTRLNRAMSAEEEALKREYTARRLTARRELLLHLLHTPTDPNATIIPLAQSQPAPAFVAELNRTLAAFLATCPDLANVYVHHDWAAMPISGVPVIAGEYTLRSGVLELRPTPLTDKRSVLLRDPTQNPRLTLARLQAEQRAQEQKRRETADWQAATYRRDFESASRRLPGIVYKGDAYWAQYPRLEMVRRVFDGDFKGSAGTTGFKALFSIHGEVFSSRCKAQVKEFVKYMIPNQVVVRTRTYASGRVENDYENRPFPVFIDKRFTPQWKEYEPAMATAVLAESGRAMREHGNPLLWKSGEFKRRMAAGLADNALLQMGAFLENIPCTSATMDQLTENMLRAAQNRPSAQAERLRFAGAEKESDRPVRP